MCKRSLLVVIMSSINEEKFFFVLIKLALKLVFSPELVFAHYQNPSTVNVSVS